MSHFIGGTRTPVLLLKTRSTPTDGYLECFASVEGGRYEPAFVPVLEHRFKQDSLEEVRTLIERGGFNNHRANARYGGIIFTSQRAVEAFTRVIEDLRGAAICIDELLPSSTPLYAVGPATASSLRALNLRCPILGEESGSGEALAHFILHHYNQNHLDPHPGPGKKLPLLFMVGEQRRDIIPRILQLEEHVPAARIAVTELVVYETGEMQSFQPEFSQTWRTNQDRGAYCQWVVVFSPTGCRAMLASLGLLDEETGKIKRYQKPELDTSKPLSKTFIATIGPTTRDYLLKEFGFRPDVCAAKPSPEGVWAAIRTYMEEVEVREET
ncbi:uroporphyrinogen-III synthase [Coniosporium apollinis]|uniref:Uroporphyrinogen-III synthase n=1 Tax=Coniosporium apollinis TaxID=61459 RepID=A0ABQ9P190_9PEZI|nr:uroporphyrinogen-III synthase [Coniosporium apollinis]